MRKALLLLALTACVDRPDRLPITEATRAKLAVHEWGTYTSLQGSDGRSMDGLHHAEHLLPPFVIARDATNLDQKAIPNLPEPVNQKLETPVIYFYGEYEEATVKVDFPGGVISEWYPDATAVAPPMDQLPSMSNGSMTWKVDLIDASDPSFAPPEVEANGIWAPSRRVSSLGVRHAEADEHFIFYRGLGRFERPFRVLTTERTVEVVNASDDPIPNAFLLSVDAEGGSIVEIGRIERQQQRSVSYAAKSPLRSYLAPAKAQVERALVETGLFQDEARAMVDTWEESYFTSPGTRVLYIAPRAWTDALLPIQIDPQPDELVRTLVGRVEIMTTGEERGAVAQIEAASKGEGSLAYDAYGRFTEPKLRRAMELIDDPAAKSWCQAFVDTLATLP